MLTMHVTGQHETALIIFLYICTCICKYPRVTILLLPARNSIFHLQGRQLCNSSGKISNGHLACSWDIKEKRCSDNNNVKIL